MAMTTRSELLARLKTDESSWNEFMKMYTAFIETVCAKFVLQFSDRQEIIQEVSFALYKGRESFEYDRTKGRFRDYLSKMIRNAITNQAKKKQRTKPEDQKLLENVPESNDQLDRYIEQEHDKLMLERGLEIVRTQVEPTTYQAFDLTELKGMTTKEAAEFLGIPTNTVTAYRKRVKDRLEEIMKDLLEEG